MHTPLYGGWGSSKRLNQKMALNPIETHKSMTHLKCHTHKPSFD